MNVYTHYRTITPSIGIRWRTLLQFGDGWNIIGSVVMKNPGSAYFASEAPLTDGNILAHLQSFDDESEPLPWYQFKPDPTMYCIRDLFAAYYQRTRQQGLQGVIKLFNLFYIREADLKDALQKQQSHGAEELLDYDVRHLVAPVYLGFGKLAEHPVYGQSAQRFFEAALSLGMAGGDIPMEQHPFYHPLYLMRHAKKKPVCVEERERFFAAPWGSLAGEKCGRM